MVIAIVGPRPGGVGPRVATRLIQGLAPALPVVCTGLAVRAGGLLRVAWTVGALTLAAAVWWYRRFVADYARALAVTPHGTLAVTDDHLVVRHAGVLAADVAIPWSVVRAICTDDGTARAGTGPSPAVRFRLAPQPHPEEGPEPPTGRVDGPRPAALFDAGPGRRAPVGIPLLAAAPVVPNLAVLLDPPIELPWRYPWVAGPFNPPRGRPWPARPWPEPALTPAILVAVADPAGLAAAAAAHAPVRDPDGGDARYLAAGGLLA